MANAFWSKGERPDPFAFEGRVRDIARERWHATPYAGAAMIDGKERDGLFVTADLVHLVEATTRRDRRKIEEICDKSKNAMKSLRGVHPNKYILVWIVTLDEPTADQRRVIEDQKHPAFRIVSYNQFSKELIDTSEYIEKRLRHSFGSARRLNDLSRSNGLNAYVPVTLAEEQLDGTVKSERDIGYLTRHSVTKGQRVVITGDFGSGKSMTLREIFLKLRDAWLHDNMQRIPIHINLREHWGQRDPAEVLERHARNIGFSRPFQIVSAWKAGFTILLLDGFDELAAEAWTGSDERVVELRRNAVNMVKRLCWDSPSKTPIFIAGRSQFFNNKKELESSLGTTGSTMHLHVLDFSQQQVDEYLLTLKKEKLELPEWLPSRPLLIGHLASHGYLHELAEANSDIGPAEGWRSLIKMICDREVLLPEVTIDAGELAATYGRIATLARATRDGLGPLEPELIFGAFRDIVGRPADNSARTLLLRLPGLGAAEDKQAGARSFIDLDLVDAAQSMDIISFILDPDNFSTVDLCKSIHYVGRMGIAITALECEERGSNARSLSYALKVAAEQGCNYLAIDILNVMRALDFSYIGVKIKISDITIEEIEIGGSTADYTNISFHECSIEKLNIDKGANLRSAPRFYGCYIEAVLGRFGPADLPEGLLDENCEIKNYSIQDRTTEAIMRMTLPLGVKVLLTILKKLFLQPGRGRLDSALVRGLDQHARDLVSQVLAIIASEGLAVRRKLDRRTIWTPARSEYARVLRILEAPSSSTDVAVVKCASMTH